MKEGQVLFSKEVSPKGREGANHEGTHGGLFQAAETGSANAGRGKHEHRVWGTAMCWCEWITMNKPGGRGACER